VVCCQTIDQDLIAIGTQFFDVILLDLNFAGDNRTGLDVFRKISATDNSADVILISGETKPDRLIQIMNAGVTRFIPRPSTSDQVRKAVRDTLKKREVRFQAFNHAAKGGKGPPPLIGNSPAMLKLKEEVSCAIQSGAKDILLVGESCLGFSRSERSNG